MKNKLTVFLLFSVIFVPSQARANPSSTADQIYQRVSHCTVDPSVQKPGDLNKKNLLEKVNCRQPNQNHNLVTKEMVEKVLKEEKSIEKINLGLFMLGV